MSVPLHSQSSNKLTAKKNKHDGAIAQLVEQRTENPCVPGSIPGGTTKKRELHQMMQLSFFVYNPHPYMTHRTYVHNLTHVRSSSNARTFISQRTYVHQPTHVHSFFTEHRRYKSTTLLKYLNLMMSILRL